MRYIQIPKNAKTGNESNGKITRYTLISQFIFEFGTFEDKHNFNFVGLNMTDFFISLEIFMLG